MAKKKKSRFSRIMLLILAGVCVYAGVTFLNLNAKIAEQSARSEQLLSQKAEIERELEYYNNEINYIGSNEYVEQQARERLGWLKKGETKYVEAEEGTAQKTAPPNSEETESAPQESPAE